MKLTEKHVEMKGIRRMVVAVACAVLGVATCASALALRMTPTIATAAAVRDTVTPRRVGGSVLAPKLIHSVQPEYTNAARKAKTKGAVLINFWVNVDGTTSHVRVVRGIGDGLDEKAIEAVKQYRFKPAMENGEPVPVTMNAEVNFRIF